MQKKKNLVVLAMSTLPTSVKAYKFIWDGTEKEYDYYGQLEPISTMIREREGSLDKVIILATEETKVEKEIKAEDKLLDGKKTSAVKFYLERMNLTEEDVEIVDVKEQDVVPAIANTVEKIRKYWEEQKENVNLWIDTQGSFRNINLVLNAVITLLEPDKIVPNGIYAMNYNSSRNSAQRIVDQTNTYKIFQFVSGVNEFTRSGRAEQLVDYYEKTKPDTPEEIQIMEKIGESIQMCDMLAFDEELKNFRKFRKKEKQKKEQEEDILLGIFDAQIQRDYGKLLEKDCTGLDVIEWFHKKGFYQQAITYLESKMPEEWIKKKIISYEDNEKVIKILKAKLNKKYEKNDNLVVSQLAIEYCQWNGIYDKDNYNNIRKNDLKKLDQGIKEDKYQKDIVGSHKMVIEVKREKIGTLNVTIHCKNKMRVMRMLLLYKILKNERNNFNHMSESGMRANKEELGDAIQKFVSTGKGVYQDVC